MGIGLAPFLGKGNLYSNVEGQSICSICCRALFFTLNVSGAEISTGYVYRKLFVYITFFASIVSRLTQLYPGILWSGIRMDCTIFRLEYFYLAMHPFQNRSHFRTVRTICSTFLKMDLIKDRSLIKKSCDLDSLVIPTSKRRQNRSIYYKTRTSSILNFSFLYVWYRGVLSTIWIK